MTVSCERLDIYIAGKLCGVLTQNRNDALSFEYVHHYEGVPLSASMPVGLERGYRIKTRGSLRQRRCRMDRCRRNARPMVPCWLPGNNLFQLSYRCNGRPRKKSLAPARRTGWHKARSSLRRCFNRTISLACPLGTKATSHRFVHRRREQIRNAKEEAC